MKASASEHGSVIITHTHSSQTNNFSMSKPIRIERSMRRTPSERQLMYQEMVADHRDYCMFQRIVRGIMSSPKNGQNEIHEGDIQTKLDHMPPQSQKVLESIVRTRNQSEENPEMTFRTSDTSFPSRHCAVTNSMALTDIAMCALYRPSRENEFLADSPFRTRCRHQMVVQQHHHHQCDNPHLTSPGLRNSGHVWPSSSFENFGLFLMDDM